MNFMDSADSYGSHPFLKRALEGVAREEYAVLTKIWPRKARWGQASGGAKAEVERFLGELGVEQLDVCLIHCCLNERWPDEYERIRDELSALKEKGTVRAAGVSCHDFGALKVAVEHPWVDVILARVNHTGAAMDAAPDEVVPVLKRARANGKTVIGMKVCGGGQLTDPDQIDASMKFSLSSGAVDGLTMGMLSPEQVDDSVARVEKALRELRA
ncbi:MAG: Aldo/keto reductase family protein [candidate division BRC1 bacterium ADurb.BinA364]|nr:MAG: Aldo/keto reductase family protein [candidate division BRC1 bacterium ADurb.BinA364]